MKLLKRKEAAEFVRRKYRSFVQRVHPKVPHYRDGRDYLYAEEDLTQWLEQQKVGSSSGKAESPTYVSGYKARGSGTRSPLANEILARLRRSRDKSTATSLRVA